MVIKVYLKSSNCILFFTISLKFLLIPINRLDINPLASTHHSCHRFSSYYYLRASNSCSVYVWSLISLIFFLSWKKLHSASWSQYVSNYQCTTSRKPTAPNSALFYFDSQQQIIYWFSCGRSSKTSHWMIQALLWEANAYHLHAQAIPRCREKV